MLNKQEMLNDIRLGFAVLQHYIRPGGPLNLTDINVHSEDFVADVLNALNGWDLVNTNRAVSNFPCLDLFGAAVKVGVQVTSEKGSAKINETLACLRKHSMSSKINHFYHFTLIPKQDTYSIHSVPNGIAFNWQEDVLDFDLVLKLVNAATDKTIVDVVHVVRKSLPRVFAAEVDRLAALRLELQACQAIFDREVMRAPFDHEDPAEMYFAIRTMRIEIQKRGASRIPNEVVAKNFNKARDVLSVCERAIRQKYPLIHEAVISHTRFNGNRSDFMDAINTMMGIRQQLEPLLDENDSILKDIDTKLGYV